jgi:DNA-binding MarR family transcriptional regulator
VQLLLAYAEVLRRHVATTAADQGLTDTQAKVLLALERPVPTRCISDHLVCDPSNVTGLVDRLEVLGLVERRAGEDDRRVKLVGLTPAGQRACSRLQAELHASVPGLSTLDAAEVDDLRDLLSRVLDAATEASAAT